MKSPPSQRDHCKPKPARAGAIILSSVMHDDDAVGLVNTCALFPGTDRAERGSWENLLVECREDQGTSNRDCHEGRDKALF